MIPKTDFPLQYIIPNLALGGDRSAGNQAYSAYEQLISAANLTFDYVLCGAYVGTAFLAGSATNGNAFIRFQAQIATGAVASEVVIAEWADQFWINKSGTTDQALIGKNMTVFFTPKLIPNGTRLSWHLWGNLATSTAAKAGMYLFGYKASEWAKIKPYDYERYMKGLVGTTTNTYPAPSGTGGGANVVTHATTAWTYGAWVNVIAANAITSPFLITGVMAGVDLTPTGGGIQAQFQIGTGAAGSEVPVDNVALSRCLTNLGQPGGGNLYLKRPVWCPANTAVSLRVAGNSAAEGYDCFVTVEVLK